MMLLQQQPPKVVTPLAVLSPVTTTKSYQGEAGRTLAGSNPTDPWFDLRKPITWHVAIQRRPVISNRSYDQNNSHNTTSSMSPAEN